MYKYLKGKEFTSEEHMLSCTEIASMYCLKHCSSKKPHSSLVSRVIKDYINSRNIKVDEIWYLGGRHAMRVYPEEIWKPALNNFVYDMHLNKNGEYEYDIPEEKSKITFFFEGNSYNKQIISFKGGNINGY